MYVLLVASITYLGPFQGSTKSQSALCKSNVENDLGFRALL